MTTDRTARATHSQDARLSNAITNTSQDAALKGASRAFGKPPIKPKPNVNTYSGINGALAAATKVGGGGGRGGAMSHQHETSASVRESESIGDDMILGYQNTGGSVSSVRALSRSTSKQRRSRADNSGFLHPSTSGMEQARSPSFIAANLAASRSPSLSPSHTGQQLSGPGLRQHTSFTKDSQSGERSSPRNGTDRVLDTTSIPPTTSLIGMFERSGQPPEQKSRAASDRVDSSRSPSRSLTASRPTRIQSPLSSPPYRPQQSFLSPQVRSPSVSPARLANPVMKAPELPTKEVLYHQVQADPSKTPLSSRHSHVTATKPVAIPKSKVMHATGRADNSSTENSFVSASDHLASPSFRAALHDSNRRLTSHSAVSVNSTTTIDSMANAIIASSLASSRAASPSRHLSTQTPPPPPSRRSPRSHSHLFHSDRETTRTPSPAKQGALRTTLRKPKMEEDVDEGDRRRSKKHIMKKHPNKHHEGDRKRWRDEVTERERKRYEAVWASNKGLHVPPSYPASEYAVCNLVVRDIFSRSRLHVDVLEEAYALVDRSHSGVLDREEFVVGLWLIDQRLKGRKLPVKVSDHVWKSVGNLGGIKVRKAGR